jgi:hypothetical protein
VNFVEGRTTTHADKIRSPMPGKKKNCKRDAREDFLFWCSAKASQQAMPQRPKMFKETLPILGMRDIQQAIDFYTKQLCSSWALESRRLRFLVEDPDALFHE